MKGLSNRALSWLEMHKIIDMTSGRESSLESNDESACLKKRVVHVWCKTSGKKEGHKVPNTLSNVAINIVSC